MYIQSLMKFESKQKVPSKRQAYWKYADAFRRAVGFESQDESAKGSFLTSGLLEVC